jgi:protein regulator of cytokinesis 1
MTGLFDAAELLATMDQQITAAKEEAQSRKEIMEKMDKWISACEEETWLEDYNRVIILPYRHAD